MLGGPTRLKTRAGGGFLLSWKHRIRADPRVLAEQLLDDAGNLREIRAALDRPQAAKAELKEWLVSALESGAFTPLVTKPKPRVLDSPPSTDLTDLLPPEEPERELESLSFSVLESSSDSILGLGARYVVEAPGDAPAGVLLAGRRQSVHQLRPDADVTVAFSALQLSLRPSVQDDSEPSPGPERGPFAPSDPVLPGDAPVEPSTLASTQLSVDVDRGVIEHIGAPGVLGPDPQPFPHPSLTFEALVLSVSNEDD
ncbi:MAG: hypothetical protein AAGA54_07115 [Myxococcota bacterium]